MILTHARTRAPRARTHGVRSAQRAFRVQSPSKDRHHAVDLLRAHAHRQTRGPRAIEALAPNVSNSILLLFQPRREDCRLSKRTVGQQELVVVRSAGRRLLGGVVQSLVGRFMSLGRSALPREEVRYG